jgi:hypothetical protein
VNKSKLVFIDQTGINLAARALYGLAPKGKKSYVKSAKPVKYSERYDVMGVINGDGVLAQDILSPEQRKRAGVRGYTKHIILQWMQRTLSKIINQTGQIGVVIVLDKGLAIKSEEVKAAVEAGGCDRVAEVWIMPTGIAKHVNPLDNSLWHQYKNCVREAAPTSHITMMKALKSCWKNISAASVTNYYHKCALFRHQDIYKDCPNPPLLNLANPLNFWQNLGTAGSMYFFVFSF